MSKIIIYDNKNILIANLDRTETITENEKDIILNKHFAAYFTNYKIIHSISLKKQLKKIEKIFKYHQEKNKEAK